MVQIRKVTAGSRLEGLVEEVDTGQQAHFVSENELLEFLRKRVAHAQQSERQGRNE